MARPPWYEDAAVDLRRLGSLSVTTHYPRATPATVAARDAALALCGWLTRDTPRPGCLPSHDAGVALRWHGACGLVECSFGADGALNGLLWQPIGTPPPDWARGVLARALHCVR